MQILLIGLFFVGIFLAILSPLAGLYVFLVISYIRPQDFSPFLANLEPAKWILIVTLISFSLHTLLRKKEFVKAGQNWAIFGILAFIFISKTQAINPFAWWEATKDFLRVFVVYFLLINTLTQRKRLKNFYIFFALVNMFVALRFYLSYRSGTATYWGTKPGDVTYGFLANADDLGIGLVVALPFVLVPIFYARNVILKGVCAIASGVFLLGILATDSRGALLGTFAVFVASFLTQLKLKKLRINKFAIGMGIFLVLFSGFILRYRYSLHDSYLSMHDEQDSGRLGRMATWEAAKNMINDKPLTGVGRGNFIAYWKTHYPPGIFTYQVAHNVLYEVAAEIGLIGLLIYLYFSVYGLKEIRGYAKRYNDIIRRNELIDMIFSIYVASLIGFFINGMFITVAFYWHIYILVALFVAAKHLLFKEVEYEKANLKE